jgi:hypothetical protein
VKRDQQLTARTCVGDCTVSTVRVADVGCRRDRLGHGQWKVSWSWSKEQVDCGVAVQARHHINISTTL